MDELGLVLKAYYQEINVIPNGSRTLDQVFARSAMMVAMRKYMSLHQVGKVFGKNHATIHHAGRKHEENMDWSESSVSTRTQEANCLSGVLTPAMIGVGMLIL